MKSQNKELKLNKKKLEKLEEKFIKVNTDFKNVQSDKTNLENFLRNLFPKEMHDKLIKEEFGSYEASELLKLWLVVDSKNQSEIQNVLSNLKNEICQLKEENLSLKKECQASEENFKKFQSENEDNSSKLNFFQNGYEELKKTNESLLNEKNYLMQILDEKNKEIEILNSLELENAELKAQSLLNDIEPVTKIEEKIKPEENINQIKILNLNIGTQTEEVFYEESYVQNLQNELDLIKKKYDKLKKEFVEYKEKSHAIFLTNEENYKKILTEHENLKKELSQLLTAYNNEKSSKAAKMVPPVNKVNKSIIVPKIKLDAKQLDIKEKISNEYLKNVLLKYLEALAIGNEFQSKILENVMFTVLSVSSKEKKYLEEKRITSSFYYNLWFNAKAFLTAKIYGTTNTEENSKEEEQGEIEIQESNKNVLIEEEEKKNDK
ncbi:MAG: hypothetical protein MJ252_13710 [archaeon]|nr:hypothetical protein [archaeon]